MLIDGGPDPTYANVLKPHLDTLSPDPTGTRNLDAVCITHVDSDHIDGIQRMLTELSRAIGDPGPPSLRIRRLWFNSVEEVVDAQQRGLFTEVETLLTTEGTGAVVGASINQGREVRNRAEKLNLNGNAPFSPLLMQGQTQTIDGLKVTVIAPDRDAFSQLAKMWREAKQKADSTVITAAYTDHSIPNLSSIALLIQHEGRSSLLTGDARGDAVLPGLASVGCLTASAPMQVDLLKLPHHGSSKNVDPGFFRQIHANHYVISADGQAHHHPSEATLDWLVQSRRPDEQYVIHLTNPIPHAIEHLKAVRRGRSFRIAVRETEQSSIVIDL
jgi:hypothetical protein